jgi:hypothetical protein
MTPTKRKVLIQVSPIGGYSANFGRVLVSKQDDPKNIFWTNSSAWYCEEQAKLMGIIK